MKKILFVDDEPNILEALSRMLFPMRKEWSMSFACGGEAALKLLGEEEFDVLVSDLRMPGMDGAALLMKVQEQHPDMVRFVLSGQSDMETSLKAVGAAHQFMAKPCNAKVLKSNVDRAFALRELLKGKQLKSLVSRADALPAAPHSYTALMKALQSPDTSIGDVGKIIESDIAMSAKVLQLVNSAFFGLGQHISAVTQAVSLLGLDTVKALVLLVGVFSQAEGKKLPKDVDLPALWDHCMTVADFSKVIARQEGQEKDVVSEAFTAGLLHDAGILLLAANFSSEYKHVLDFAFVNDIVLAEAEREHLGCTHAEAGAYLLGIWGLPDPILEAVAFHHCPRDCPGTAFGPLTMVHVANYLARETHGAGGEWSAPNIDQEYLQALGLEDRLDTWRDACSKSEAEKGARA